LNLPRTLDLCEILIILRLFFGLETDAIDLLLVVLQLKLEHLRECHGLEVDLAHVLASLLHDLLPVALLDGGDLQLLDQRE
jgi:hypothetical protein